MKLKLTAVILTTLAVVTGLMGGPAGATTQKPTNDDFAEAAAIQDTDFTEQRDLSGATLESKEVLPSCGKLKGSVWYRFDAPDDKVYTTWFQATFDAGIAAYRATASGLREVSCMAVGIGGSVDLDAQRGETFYIQLGNTRRKQGVFEFGTSLAQWQEKTLYERSYTHDMKEQQIQLVTVRGRPHATDRWLYDVEIGISDQVPVKQSILTFGLVQRRIDVELVRIPASTTSLEVRVVARYDTTQQKCVVGDVDTSGCTAYAPVNDPDRFAREDGTGSHLAIEVTAMHNRDVQVQQSFLIPFAGQLGGTVQTPLPI